MGWRNSMWRLCWWSSVSILVCPPLKGAISRGEGGLRQDVLALRVNFRKRTHSDIRLEFFLMAASGLSCSSWTLVA